jgi:pyruvate ferredoxin oxidoreductase alpha subunit
MIRPQILSGSRAIAETIANLEPAVVSAYPITPQTHIVEDLAAFRSEGKADYEYVRAESEFAAASIVLGASASGLRTYSATSSQGLLLMAEVVYNIAGLRLPVVMTDANRAISAPINIWNDQQDIMSVRDSGWLMFFAENHQEAVTQHILAFKIAETLSLPAFINVDGFILTHSYEPVMIPDKAFIRKLVPAYKPKKGSYLDPSVPTTIGALVSPLYYSGFRKQIQEDMLAGLPLIIQEYSAFISLAANWMPKNQLPMPKGWEYQDNGLYEYWGPKKPKAVIVAMGSVIGTIKAALIESPDNNTGVLKIRSYRPFPGKDIIKLLNKAENAIIIDRSISLGAMPPLYSDIAAALQKTGNKKPSSLKLTSHILGLGGQDITIKDILNIIKQTYANKNTD